MSTNFPSSVDTFPAASVLTTHTLGTDPHSLLHGNLGDALNAVESWLLYTITTSNIPEGSRLYFTTARAIAACAGTYLTTNQTITISGDASGSGSTAITLTLPDVATAGTYGQVVVNAKGQVTSGATCDVAHGGTGLTTLTIHALYAGNTTSAPTALAVGATNTLLHGNTGADPSFSAVVEADLSLTDVTTANVSTSAHGFAPKSPNDSTKFLNGVGTYTVPEGGAGANPSASVGLVAVNGSAVTFLRSDGAPALDVTAAFAFTNLGSTTITVNGAASHAALSLTGTIFTGGTATTTKPQLLVEPAGTTSTGWSTAGTLFGANAPSGFTGNLLDLQVAGSSVLSKPGSGQLSVSGGTPYALDSSSLVVVNFAAPATRRVVVIFNNTGAGVSASSLFILQKNGSEVWSYGNDIGDDGTQNYFIYDSVASKVRLFIDASGHVGIGSSSSTPGAELEVDASSSSTVVTIAKGAASQSADLWQGQKSDGTVYTSVSATGVVNKYDSVATVGKGHPAIYGYGRATAQVAANASVATYTNGAADGTFRVSANVLVTTATVHNFTATVTYTDEGNTSRTVTMQFSTLAGAFVTAMTNTQGTVPYEGVPLHIRCKASTAITIATTGVFTTVVYNVEGMIEQLA